MLLSNLIAMKTKKALDVHKEQTAVLGRKSGECPKIGMLQEHEMKFFVTIFQ